MLGRRRSHAQGCERAPLGTNSDWSNEPGRRFTDSLRALIRSTNQASSSAVTLVVRRVARIDVARRRIPSIAARRLSRGHAAMSSGASAFGLGAEKVQLVGLRTVERQHIESSVEALVGLEIKGGLSCSSPD
jgi:hypothetical protein